jgi:hypothetical protein
MMRLFHPAEERNLRMPLKNICTVTAVSSMPVSYQSLGTRPLRWFTRNIVPTTARTIAATPL